MAHGGAVTEGGVTRVTMPQLGESVTEGQISRWLKQPGDPVEKYEALVEVITDKVNAEVPSPVAGVLADINVQEGETVAVGTLICSIGVEAGDGDPAAAAAVEAGSGGAAPGVAAGMGAETGGGGVPLVAEAAALETRAARIPGTPTPATAADSNGHDRSSRASPAVRRLASEHDLDLSRIKGTGIGGRVTKRDVEEFIGAGGPPPGHEAMSTAVAAETDSVAPAAAAAPAPKAPSPPAPQARPGDELVALTP
ncbi:MAG: E3 binding domain-containing protein, partial [Candidatus Dormibacteraeota bacterium]|nr:E3 binding domain-containing protein [Candidatus Dormibacteraeota bacterium]